LCSESRTRGWWLAAAGWRIWKLAAWRRREWPRGLFTGFDLVCLQLLVRLRELVLLLPRLPGLGLLLLGLPSRADLHRGVLVATAGWSGLPSSLHLEHDEVPHEPGLQQAHGHQGVQPEQAGVEVAGGEVDDLLLDGSAGQTEPEGEHGQDDAAQPGEDEQQVSQLEQLAGDGGLLGVGEDAAGVEHGLGQVVDEQEEQPRG